MRSLWPHERTMKKLRQFKRKKAAPEQPTRITNETVAEHREQILAGGRRFKYPVQYARHRLVINTIIISVIALILIVGFVWWQLYPQQNTSTFFYRIARVLPLSVATVDGQAVPYSDYLVAFRSQAHYVQTKEGVDLYSKENKKQLEYFKRRQLDNAIADSYAEKIAKQEGIAVTQKQVDEAIVRQRQSRNGVISQETYDATTLDLYGLTRDEVRHITERGQLRQAVAYAIDSTAKNQLQKVTELLKTEKDFDKIAAQVGGTGAAKVISSITPPVPVPNQDGGMAEAASKLQVGQVTEPFKSTKGDGYYIVKLLEKSNDGKVSYAYLSIPLTEFNKQLQAVKKAGKIKEYIAVPVINDKTVSQ